MTRKALLLATCLTLLLAGFAAAAPARRTRPLLFVPSFSSNIVTVFDLRTNARVASIGLGARGACCAYASPDRSTVYVVGGLSPEVTEIDTRTLKVRRVIDTPGVSGDHGSAMPRDGRLFWFDDIPQGDVAAIDTRTHAVARVFAGIGGLFGNSLDGRWIYQQGGSDGTSFTVRDARNSSVVASIPLPHANAQSVQVAPDDRTAYVVGGSTFNMPGVTPANSWVEIVDVHDPQRPRYVTSIEMGPFPEIGTFTPDGSEFWVPCTGDGRITVIDTRNYRVLRTLDTGRYITFVNFSGRRAYLSQSPSRLPPSYATALALTAAAVVPGAAVTPTSGSSQYRAGIDPPGEIAVWDRLTYRPLPLPPLPLPSESFVSETVDAPY
jgi:DNA-binding beta-propeller fold protein YncE